MQVANAQRQVEEIRCWMDQCYDKGVSKNEALQVLTPTLFTRLEGIRANDDQLMIPVKKCLQFQLNFTQLYEEELNDATKTIRVRFEFPLDYPSASICEVQVYYDDDDSKTTTTIHTGCTQSIQTYLKDFVGCECVELVADWILENQATCFVEGDGTPNPNTNSSGGCFILRFNHLLSGPEHKKEKAMLTAAKKSHLQGGLLWGTPGLVIVVSPSTYDDAKDYAQECRTIGKRVEGAIEEVDLPAWEDGGLGGLAQQKRGGKLKELTTADLRQVCGVL